MAVVGHVGSGTSEIAKTLQHLLEQDDLQGGKYDAVILKARQEIEEWATSSSKDLPTSDRNDVETTKRLQDLGDEMRSEAQDASAVARALVKRIRSTRADKLGSKIEEGGGVTPDGTRRAYILDAIRNPAEVELFPHVYQDAFVLIGVVCDEKVLLQRIMEKYKNAGKSDGEELTIGHRPTVRRRGQGSRIPSIATRARMLAAALASTVRLRRIAAREVSPSAAASAGVNRQRLRAANASMPAKSRSLAMSRYP